jgi:type I restriction enzyme S subunit
MSEWQVKPLAELADIRISNVDKKSVIGELPVRLCNYMDVYAGRYLVNGDRYMEATCTTPELAAFGLRRGDVLITKDSESPDDIAIPALIDDDVQELVCGYHLAVLRLKSDEIDPIVLLKQLESERLRRYFGQRAGGSTRYGLSTRAISQAPILVPPKKIQRRIGEIHRSLDTQITHTEALIAKQEQVRAGLMQDLFTRGVDETGRLRPPREEAPELYHETALGWLPKGWETAFLSERAPASGGHLKTGPFGSSLKISHWVEIGHPVITIGSLGVGCFIHDELLFVGSETARQLEGYRVAPGDIVFSRVADVGRSVVVDETSDGWIISSNLMRLRVDSAGLRPEMVHLQLAYDPGLRSQLRRTVNSSGREVANAKIMNALRFLSPPMAEQDRVCELACRQQQLIRVEATLLQTLCRQRTALLRDLLTPPASAAAEPRIAAE